VKSLMYGTSIVFLLTLNQLLGLAQPLC
jgi:hypothetical protein